MLDTEQRAVEDLMLGIRLSAGLAVDSVPAPGRSRLLDLARDGLVEVGPLSQGRVVLTLGGRLLADLVVRSLMGWDAAAA